MNEFNVPINMGHILGNTLRQIAIRGTETWRVAGYSIPNRDLSYGVSGDKHFSVMEFLKGTLEYTDTPTSSEPKLLTMIKNNDQYICDGFILKNLGHLNMPSLDVFIVLGSGMRTQQDNFDLLKETLTLGYESYVCIPTRHSESCKLSFSVEPKSNKEEILTIKSDETTLKNSLQRLSLIVNSLQQTIKV